MKTGKPLKITPVREAKTRKGQQMAQDHMANHVPTGSGPGLS
jgi:hypothetical protein